MSFAAVVFANGQSTGKIIAQAMPGALVFRTVSGFLRIDGAHPSAALIGQTVANGATAAAAILVMSVGLIVPKLMTDRLWDGMATSRRREAKNEFLPEARR